MTPAIGQARLTQLRPMLAVTDLQRTMAFYQQCGFEVMGAFGNPPVWCELHRDGQAVMFNAPPRDSVVRDVPRSSKDYQIFYFNADDVVALHAEFKAKGLPVSDLRVAIYQMKEFELRDPDDYWMWFGQPTDDPPTVDE
jgi:catechol 2,3-dioxygenase-like lactoylglutathione lyase family enzyme